jgi:hypothetical protein
MAREGGTLKEKPGQLQGELTPVVPGECLDRGMASPYNCCQKSRFQKLRTDLIGVFFGKCTPVIPKTPSNEISRKPSKKSPIRDF